MKRLLALCPILALLLTGCGREEAPYSRTTFAMDTVMSLEAYGPQAEAAIDKAVSEIFRLQGLLSVTDEHSQLWAVNHSDGITTHVSADTAYLLDLAQEIGDRSGGALDVSLYPVLRAWGFTTDTHQIPSEATLDALLPLVDYSAVRIDGDNLTLPEGMELDMGAIAKGYAGQRCADILREEGVSSAILNLGGNIQAVGTKPSGKPWRVLIQDPKEKDGAYAGVLELADQAAVTSGGYERNFVEDGITYWHILDPKTGWPARSGLQSVTIVGDNGTLCDGLSTALFVLGTKEALDYWRAWGGFEAILIDDDDVVWITAGLADRFTLNEDSGYTLKLVEV